MKFSNANSADMTFKTGIRLENNVSVDCSYSSYIFVMAIGACLLTGRFGWAMTFFILAVGYIYLARTGRWVLEIDSRNGRVTRYFQSIFRLENETVSAKDFDVVAMRRKLRLHSQKGRSHCYFHVIYLEQEGAEDNREFECQPLVNYRQCRTIATKIASCLGKDLVDHTTVQADRVRANELDKPLVHLLHDRQEVSLPPTPVAMRSHVEHEVGSTTITIPPIGFELQHAVAKMTPAWFLGGLLLLGTILNAIQGELETEGLGYIVVFIAGLTAITLRLCWYPAAFKKEQVRIADGRLTIHSTHPTEKMTQFPTEEIMSIVGCVDVRSPSLPGVTVMARNYDATFGSELSDDEQRYLCGVVRAAIVLNHPCHQIHMAELVESGI